MQHCKSASYQDCLGPLVLMVLISVTFSLLHGTMTSFKGLRSVVKKKQKTRA